MNRETQRHAVCCALVEDVAGAGGAVRLMVRGASMLPAVWPGDVVTVRSCGFGALRAGQIVLFHRDGKLTAHRIQNLTNNEIMTRGDSLSCFDAPVRASEIVGRVESLCRDGRTLSAEQRLWQRVAAWILRRSALCLRATLYVSRRVRRDWEMESGQVSSPAVAAAKR